MINLTIDGVKVQVPKETSILKAAEQAHVKIPRLCYLDCLEPYGACRVCSVEVEGDLKLSPSCTRPVTEGMSIRTNTPRVRRARHLILELLMTSHVSDCKSCVRNQTCELLKLTREAGMEETRFQPVDNDYPVDITSAGIIRDPNKCILCGRCIRVCDQIQSVSAIGFVNRGAKTRVSTFEEMGLGQVQCTNCGQCIHVCPVAALREQPASEAVWQALENPNLHTVVQEAPAIRASLPEALGMEPGTLSPGKMHAALRRLGFNAVFDTNFSADLTIMEEGSELIERLTKKGVLPMITSCSPGWIKFMEHFFPDLRENVSTCKSPQQMFGALAKTYYAKNANIDPAKIVSVSIMPCTAKKFEAQRPEMNDSGYRDVDYVLTTRELAQMIQTAGIDFKDLPEETPDNMMGVYTGAATIFGATGGVMEAALRSAYKLITGNELENLNIMPVRGMDGIKEATVDVAGTEVKVAIAHGLGNARTLMNEIREGTSPYHFIEIMACPGGCIGGGGQPIGFNMDRRSVRADALYREDSELPLRCSHENPAIHELYETFLEKPLGEKSHHLLHTHYEDRSE